MNPIRKELEFAVKECLNKLGVKTKSRSLQLKSEKSASQKKRKKNSGNSENK